MHAPKHALLGAQASSSSFAPVAMHLAFAIPVVIPGPLVPTMADGRVVTMAAMITPPLMCIEDCAALRDVLNGMITNDKFCCTRWSELQLSWWRRPLRLRSDSD